MSFNINSLTDYVNEQKLPLISKAIIGGKTIQTMLPNLRTGIKSAEKLNLLSTSVTYQDGNTWGITDADTTTLSQRTLSVGSIKVVDKLSIGDLEKKWASTQMQLGANAGLETVPFEQQIMDQKMKEIAKKNEYLVWQGNTSLTGSTYLKYTDGLIKTLNGACLTATTTATAVTVSNAYDIVQSAINKLPSDVYAQSDVVVYVGVDFYRIYAQSVVSKNYFQVALTKEEEMEMYHPNTNIKVIAVAGLDGTNSIYAMSLSNGYPGTDLEGDFEKAESWYEKKDEAVYIKFRFKIGVQVAYPDQVVTLKVS